MFMAESEVAFQFLGETMNIIFFRNAYCICFLHLYLRKTFQLYYFHGYWKRHLRSRGIAECLGRDILYSKATPLRSADAFVRCCLRFASGLAMDGPAASTGRIDERS